LSSFADIQGCATHFFVELLFFWNKILALSRRMVCTLWGILVFRGPGVESRFEVLAPNFAPLLPDAVCGTGMVFVIQSGYD